MSLEWRAFATADEMASALAKDVARALAGAIERQGRATLAVPGGTTPAAFLARLSSEDIDWPRVTATLTDERWVPPQSERSNERLLRASLMQGRAAALNFVPLFTDAPSPESALAEVTARLDAVLPLDVCVVGMGTDAHTASLFPGADRLEEALDPNCPHPVLPMRAAGAGEDRVTLTVPVLAGAGQTYLLIAGAEKAAVLQRALGAGPASEAPIRAVIRGPRPVQVFHAP